MGLFRRKKPAPSSDEIIFKHISLALDGAKAVESFVVLLEATKNLLAQVPVEDRRELGSTMFAMLTEIAKPDEKEVERLLPQAANVSTELNEFDATLLPLAERVQWAIRNGAVEAQDNNLGAVASAIAGYVGITLKSHFKNPARGVVVFARALLDGENDPRR